MHTAAANSIASVLVCERNATSNAARSSAGGAPARAIDAGHAMSASAATATDCANALVRLPVVSTPKSERHQVIDRDRHRRRETVAPVAHDERIEQEAGDGVGRACR